MKVARLTIALVLVSLMAGLVLAQDPLSRRQVVGRGRGRLWRSRRRGGVFERLTDAVRNWILLRSKRISSKP